MPTEIKEIPKDDAVNSPRHYLCPFPISVLYKDSDGNYYLDALAVIKAWGWQSSFYIGNVLKYILRSGKKVGESIKKDLKKSAFYLNEEIAEMEDKELNIPNDLIKGDFKHPDLAQEAAKNLGGMMQRK